MEGYRQGVVSRPDDCEHRYRAVCYLCGHIEAPLTEEDKERAILRLNDTVQRLNAQIAILRAFQVTK